MLQQERAKGCLRGKCDTVAVYSGGVGGDQVICETTRTDMTGGVLLTQLIKAFLCLFIHLRVFDLLPQCLTLHNFLLYCITAEAADNVIGPCVLPSYAHTRMFSGRMCGEKWLEKFWSALCGKIHEVGGEHLLKVLTYFVDLHLLSRVFSEQNVILPDELCLFRCG